MSGRTLLCLCSFVCGVRVLQWTCVHASLVPRPHPDFCCLQYGKAGEAWYLFSWCNQKMTKICRTSRLHLRVFSTDYTLNAQCVIPSSPTSYIHVVSYNVPGTLALSLFWAQAPTHNLSLSTIFSILMSLTWEMIPGPSPTFPYCKQQKAGRGLGMRLCVCTVWLSMAFTTWFQFFWQLWFSRCQ